MIIYVDVKTLALTTEGCVPLTDMALVRGDKVPLRIVLQDGDSQEVPVLAVKKSLGNDTLVLGATGLERVTDAMGTAYVGHLSVNTTQLADAMGSQDRIDLVGEVVLVAPDGSQRTSRLIRVMVRADLLAGDYAPPEEILTDWHNLIAAALAAQLPDALHDAGMYVTATDGETTLSTNMQITHRRAVTYYRLPLDHRNIIGHLAGNYSINAVTLRGNVSSTAVFVEIYRLANGAYSLLGRSINAVAITHANNDVTWTMPTGISVAHDDTIILRLVDADNTDAVLTLGITQVAASDPETMADIVDGLINPQRVVNPAYPLIRHLLYFRLGMSYYTGISVGGVELASKEHFDVLSQDVVTTGQQVHQNARTASDAAEAAQQSLAAIPQADTEGNMTVAGGLSAATITNTRGAWVTPMGTAVKIGAYIDNPTAADNDKRWLYISNHQGGSYLQTYGVVNGRVAALPLSLTLTHFIDGFSCGGGATFAGTINANGGINIPVAPPTPTHAARLADVQRSALMSVNHYHPTAALAAARLGTVSDRVQGLCFGAPGSSARGLSAVSLATATSAHGQTRPAIIKVTLTSDHWGSTIICASSAADIMDGGDGPLLSSGAIAQLTINSEDANDAYAIHDATGAIAAQGTLPRTVCGRNAVVDYYVIAWRDRIYFYQGASWTNDESQGPGSSADMPAYLGHAPRGGQAGTVNLVVAKGSNAHQQSPAGCLQGVAEFRLPDASVFFPSLND